MKNKVSPFIIAGCVALIVGGGLNIVFRFVDVGWDYGLLTMCFNGLAIILASVGIYKTAKASKEEKARKE